MHTITTSIQARSLSIWGVKELGEKNTILFVLLGHTVLLGLSILLRQGVVFTVKARGLLLEILEILVLPRQLALETRNLPWLAGHSELLSLLRVLFGPFVLLDLLLEPENL